MADTAISQAFRKAGFVHPKAKLHDIGIQVLEKFPCDWRDNQAVNTRPRTDANYPKLKEITMQAFEKTGGNWQAALDMVYDSVRNDAQLLWALFEPYRGLAVQNLLAEVRREEVERKRKETAARESVKPAGGGHTMFESQRADAPTQPVRGRGPDASASKPSAAIPRAMAHAAVVVVAQATILDTLMIDGVKFGDCTPEHARSWALNRSREARFIEMATSNLPRGEPIKKWLKPEEANKIWKLAIGNNDEN